MSKVEKQQIPQMVLDRDTISRTTHRKIPRLLTGSSRVMRNQLEANEFEKQMESFDLVPLDIEPDSILFHDPIKNKRIGVIRNEYKS